MQDDAKHCFVVVWLYTCLLCPSYGPEGTQELVHPASQGLNWIIPLDMAAAVEGITRGQCVFMEKRLSMPLSVLVVPQSVPSWASIWKAIAWMSSHNKNCALHGKTNKCCWRVHMEGLGRRAGRNQEPERGFPVSHPVTQNVCRLAKNPADR